MTEIKKSRWAANSGRFWHGFQNTDHCFQDAMWSIPGSIILSDLGAWIKTFTTFWKWMLSDVYFPKPISKESKKEWAQIWKTYLVCLLEVVENWEGKLQVEQKEFLFSGGALPQHRSLSECPQWIFACRSECESQDKHPWYNNDAMSISRTWKIVQLARLRGAASIAYIFYSHQQIIHWTYGMIRI